MSRTFSMGGVHPPENKISREMPIERLPVPETVVIHLSQHIGAPAVALVEKGDKVKAGQFIASAKGVVSSNVHSSVSGTVTAVDLAKDAGGLGKPSITITVEGDEWDEKIDKTDSLITGCSLSSEEIIRKIFEAGIVGLGGATFPTQVKLTLPPGKKAECLIVNGVECEPYLTSDHRLMLEKTDEILVGVEILCKALGVSKAYIGIEKNKPDAIARMTERASQHPVINIVPLKVRYPQGGEKQLIDAILRRQVPSGKLPIDVGVVVQNVGTAFAVYEAVQKNKPLIERVVTVTGKGLSAPRNLLVRIGTPVNLLLEACGYEVGNNGKIINGGPMMGRAVSNTDAPVTKGTSGIIAMPEKESRRRKATPCIRCARCVNVCPAGLEPYLLSPMSERGMFAELENERITDCIECGCCSYICPASLPLLDYIRLGKTGVIKMIHSRK